MHFYPPVRGQCVSRRYGLTTLLTLLIIAGSLWAFTRPTYAQSTPGAALDFDGVDDYVDITDSSALNSYSELTIEYWIKPQVNPSSFQIWLGKRTLSNNSGFVFETSNNAAGVTHYFYTSGGWKAVGSDYTPNVWQHVAVVAKAGDTLKVYQNGVEKQSVSLAGLTLIANTVPLRLMADTNVLSQFAKGQLDEVRIWTRALSKGEIQAGLNCEVPSGQNGLVIRYGFNQGVALANNAGLTTLTDNSGNSRNGVLGGFALDGGGSNWVAPGGVTSGVTCPLQAIGLTGNGVAIANNAATPTAANHTDFGSADVSSGTVAHTFTIANAGINALSLSGAPRVALSGDQAGDFSVTTQPDAAVAASGNTTFQITFDPSGPGVRTATVTIASNDSATPNYTFAISGVGTQPNPTLTIPNTPQTITNGKLTVPVQFTGNGNSIASVGFALNYDTSCLSIAATDADSNGIPDAVSGLPAAFAPSISLNGSNNSLEVALYDDTQPISTFGDGALFTVQFTVAPACITTDGSTKNVTVGFAASPLPTFGNPAAQDVAGTATGATIALTFNAAPTALALSNSSVAENSAAGATVGDLTTTDLDSGDSHSYTLVTGDGSDDNASFVIEGSTLKTAAVFDYETKSSYAIRLRTTDSGGLFFEQSFTITVLDVNEAPTAVDDLIDPRTTIFLGGVAQLIDVLANDLANGGVLQVASVTQPDAGKGSVTNNTANVSYTAPQANGNATFTYQANNGQATAAAATVTVNYVANHARGDCNGNGNVAAADFIAVVLEIFDTANDQGADSDPAWWLSHTGDFAGSPLGCDANNSRNGTNATSDSVTAADIICTVLIFFGHECGGTVQAAGGTTTAHLAVVDAQAAAGATTTLTVTLATGGNGIAAATFALTLDPATLHFDATDGDADGVPDALTLNTPAGMSNSATWNADANRLEVALFGLSLPLPTLTAGTLATVAIAVAADAPTGATPLVLDLVSFSDPDGNDLPFTEQDGALVINPDAPRTDLFLPLIIQ